MNNSYKSFKLFALIAFGFLAFTFSTSLNAQTFYSKEQSISILKNENLTLSDFIQNNHGSINANTSTILLNYHEALINYWAGLLANNNNTNNGSDIAYAINHFLYILYDNKSDSADDTATFSKTEAEVIRNQTLAKLSH